MNGEVERFNRNIKKRVQIAHVENQDYRIALFDYLQVYHNTVHSAIGTTPAALMLGHELNDKLPSIKGHSTNILHENIIETHDAKKREAMEKVNSKRNAQPTAIEVGDCVVLKNQKIRPGYIPPFGPEKFTVQKKDERSCTVLSEDGKSELIRHPSHMKKLPILDTSQNFLQEKEEEDVVIDPLLPNEIEDTEARTSRGRVVKKPIKYKDYVQRVKSSTSD